MAKRSINCKTLNDVRSGNYRNGGLLFQGNYDVDSSRLNGQVAQMDEDGDEIQFLASFEAEVSSGRHMRFIFMKPTAGAENKLEQVELVCNTVSYEPEAHSCAGG